MKRFLKIFFLISLGIIYVYSQEMPVPLDLQLNLLPKILLYEKNLRNKKLKVVNVGVVYQRKFRTSLNVKNEIMDYVKNNPLKIEENSILNFIPIPIEKESDITPVVIDKAINVLYLCPLKAVNMNSILEITREKKILTFSGVIDYIDMGISVVIDVKGEKPLITINLPSSKLEGADFSSQLLKLARVIQ